MQLKFMKMIFNNMCCTKNRYLSNAFKMVKVNQAYTMKISEIESYDKRGWGTLL